jgi:hypothetical protein
MSAIVHVKSITIADGTNTSIVIPSDWNSGHNQLATLDGNTVGVATLSGTNFIFAGGNNVTLSGVQGVDAATITISAGADTVDQISISAGTTSGVLGSLVFSNLNGVSFGLDGSTISASHNALTSQSNQAFSAVGGSSTFQTLSFNNANGVSFNNVGGAVEASIATSLSNIRISGGTTSNLLSAITFSDSNGVSFGLNGSVMTATVQTNYLTTARASTDAVGLATAQTNVTWTVNSAGLSLNAAGYAGTGFTSTTTAGTAIVGTQNTAGLSLGVPAYLTTAMLSNAATLSNIRVSGGTTSNLLSAITFADGNGVSFGLNASTMTASIATSLTAIRVSGGTTSNLLSAITFGDANGISFGINASMMTASHNALTSQSNQNVTAGNGGFAFQTLSFSNINGVSFGTSAGSAITASVAAGATATGNLGAIAVNAATTYTSGTVVFSNSNGITFGTNAQTITASVATSLTAVNLSAGTTSNNLSAMVFSNSNNVSFGLNGSTVTATITVPAQTNQQMTLFATGNTTQSTTGTTNASSIIFRGEGLASVGITAGSIVISVPAGAPSPVNFSAGTTSGNLGSVVFSNSNRVSFGLDGATITAQHALNFSAGTTSQNIADGVVFSNSNGISFGLNGSTITGSVAAGGVTLSSYENMPGGMWGSSAVTFGVTSLSSAVAFQMPQAGSFSFIRIPVLMTMGSTTIATIASATATAQMGQSSTLNAVVYSVGSGASSRSLMSVASGSGTVNLSVRISISNSTQGSYSLAYSGLVEGGGTTLTTQYSISNTNYSFTSQAFAAFSSNRFLDIPFANSLPAGQYWLIVGRSTSSSSAGVALSAITSWGPRYSNHYAGTQGNLAFRVMGSTNMTSGGLNGAGVFSTAGGGTTANLPISAISSTASNPRMYFQMLRSA